MPAQQFKAPLIGVLLLIQMTVSILGGIVLYGTPAAGEIKKGISVHNVELGGLTFEAGLDTLSNSLPVNLGGRELKLTYNEKSWFLFYRDLDARYDFEKILREAGSINAEGGFWQQRFKNFSVSRKGLNIPLFVSFDESKLDSFLQQLAADIDTPGINAGVELADDQLTVTPEVKGHRLNISDSGILVKKVIQNQSLNEVALVVNETEPDLTAGDLQGIKDSLALTVTLFNPKDVNRTQNIMNASRAIDGVIIKPGDEFSFNAKTGPRLSEMGYLKAPVIKNKVLTLDVGGGVCQVATTLYQAVLFAGLEVVERSPHTIPPSYVPLGQDAVVAGNTLDFKFINSQKVPIYINSRIDENKLIVRLFGKKQNQFEVRISTEDIREIKPKVRVVEDANLFQGTSKIKISGQSGFSANVYREFLENGRVIKRELISHDYYRPTDIVMVTGTKINSTSEK